MSKITEAKQNYSLEEVARRLGLNLSTSNGELVCTCPFHDDAHPSLKLSSTGKFAGRYKCWSCSAQGDIFDLIVHVMQLSTGPAGSAEMQALDWLSGQNRREPIAPPKVVPDFTAPDINGDLSVFAFEAFVERSDAAVKYLVDRRLGPVMDDFRLGSTDDPCFPRSLLPLYWSSERGYLTPHTNFLNRVVIPYPSPDGVTRHVNARAMSPEQKPKFLKAQRPQGGVISPYNLDMLLHADADDIWICESEMDCLSLYVAAKADKTGDHQINACAIGGVNGLPASYLPKLAGKTIWLLLDADDAGRKATAELAELLAPYARMVHHVKPHPGCKDVNEMLVRYGRDWLHGWVQAIVKEAKYQTTARKSF